MAIPYRPPGVGSVTESPISSLVPGGESPIIPALVGEARGYETTTDSAILNDQDPVTIRNEGVILDSGDIVSVTKISNYQIVSPGNYTISQTSPSGGTIPGDSVTTISRVEYPAPVTLASSGAGALTGHYRYNLSWYYGLDPAGAPIESGLDEDNAEDIQLVAEDVAISGIAGGTAPSTPAGVATGKVLYRSKNLGSPTNPVWGPWYRIQTFTDLVTDTTTDDRTDSSVSTEPVAKTGLSSGDSVSVLYRYADRDYYRPTLFTDLNDVVARFGVPLDEDGNVDSKLSLAANLAFANGATVLVCVALPQNYGIHDLNNALTSLEDEEVAIVSIADGSVDALTLLNAHVSLCIARKKYRVGLAGRDGVITPVSDVTLRNNAQAIQNEAIQLYSPPVVKYRNNAALTDSDIGSQYLGSAMSGFYAGRRPHETATKRSIAGLVGLGGSHKTANSMNVDAQNGLTVVEDSGGILRIRHSISTDRTSINTQEFSVTVAKHAMLRNVISVIDNSIIGKVIADDLAPTHITALISDVLDRLVGLKTIVSYSGLSATPVPGNPTVFNLRWTYRPTYYINNVDITFSIDLASGSVDVVNLLGSTGSIL